MVVGSKVRMLHGVGEGIVTKVDGNQLVVLLNQGLEIPMRKQDVVEVASRQEEKSLPKEDTAKPPMLRQTSRMFFVKEGVFLAGTPKSAMLAEYFLVNHTDYNLFVVIHQLGRPVNKFLESMEIKPKSVNRLNEAFPMGETNHVVGLAFQILKFHPEQGDPQPVSEFRLAFSQVDWKKQQNKIPLMEKEGLLIQLDVEFQKVDPVRLKEEMMTPRPPKVVSQNQPRKIENREVDLHIEKLCPNPGELSASEILAIQLDAFEAAFDKALVESVQNLILIHGVGSGVLKDEIHRRLAKRKEIVHFKDAQKNRFGYGATEIRF